MRRLILLAALLGSTVHAAEPLTIDVYRDPNCGCCSQWIKHLEANGFAVHDHMEPNMSELKARLGVPPRFSSCHTGVIDGKFVEGHVPAHDVLTLRQRLDLLGVAVPGMPLGSPGMEMGNRKDAYEVLGLKTDGKDEVVSRH